MISLKRYILVIATMLLCMVQVSAYNYELTGTIKGTTYYIGVNNKGNLTTSKTKDANSNYTWVCIVDAKTYGGGRLTPVNGRLLYTIVNNTRYWLIRNPNNNQIMAYSTSVPSAYWKTEYDTKDSISSSLYYHNSTTTMYPYYSSKWMLSADSTISYIKATRIASYTSTKATVKVQASKGGTISVSSAATESGETTVTIGGNVPMADKNFYVFLHTNKAQHYYFNGWTKDPEGSPNPVLMEQNGPYNVTVPSSAIDGGDSIYTYTANFKQENHFAFSATTGISIDAYGGSASVDYNQDTIWTKSAESVSIVATYTASIPEGYSFSGWTKTKGKTTPDNLSDNPMVANPITITLTNKLTGTTYTEPMLYAIFAPLPDPTDITVSPTSLDMAKDTTQQLSITITPANAYKKVSYSSSNETVATVSNTGLITSLKQGSTNIIVTAYKLGDIVVKSATVPVRVMTKLPTPVLTITPVENNPDSAWAKVAPGEGSPEGMTIRYTLVTGGEVTETSTVFPDSVKMKNLQTITTRAFCTGWYPSDIVSQIYSKNKVSTPTINITKNENDNDKVVTFSCPDEGVTFYYTSDGSTPTTSSTSWTESQGAIQQSSFANECTIKVIATYPEWENSNVASAAYIRGSGVSGGTVILNDYEDHTWTYYKGVDTSIDGGKYNTEYKNLLYSPNPRNVKITYEGVDLSGNLSSNVAVSMTESENRFVYYETLEQDSTSPGEYPYQTIPNPFSKRPKLIDTYYGFAGWKVKEGYEYIRREDGTMATKNAVLNLNEAISFVGLPYPSVNCTSAEILLQATWAPASVQTITSTLTTTIEFSNPATYETNFVVLQIDAPTLTVTSPCTIMGASLPDGSENTTPGSLNTLSSETNQGIKLENLTYSGKTLDANGKSLYIGRGFNTTNKSLALYGYTSNATVDMRLNVESGRFNELILYNLIKNSSFTITKMLATVGSDYNRAKNDNEQPKVPKRFQLIYKKQTRVYKPHDEGDLAKLIIKSGKYLYERGLDSSASNDSSLYLWEHEGAGFGSRSLEIQGGEIQHICGGRDEKNDSTKVTLRIRMKGGTVHGAFYMGAAYYPAVGAKRMVITGGNVEGWIAGGSDAFKSTKDTMGVVLGKSYIYVGGRSRVDSKGSIMPIDAGLPGNVFGAGIGRKALIAKAPGSVYWGTNVVVADDAYVERGVYAGGSFGRAGIARDTEQGKIVIKKHAAESNLYITGGYVAGKSGGVNMNTGSTVTYSPSVTGGVFGGACRNGGGRVNIYMAGGTVMGGLYGGSNAEGEILENVNMYLYGGTVGSQDSLLVRTFGGGYGPSTNVAGNVSMTIGKTGLSMSPYFYGNCYGGSALGKVTGNVLLTINKGASYCEGDSIYGEIFCGGLGEKGNDTEGFVGGTLTTVINGTDAKPGDGLYAFNHVFGGSHYINQTQVPTVTVNNCDVSIKKLYGGSKMAEIGGTNITVNGGNTIGYLFGGSFRADVGTSGVKLKIGGGAAEHVFGGNDESGFIKGPINVSIDQIAGSCNMNLGEVYGGGNMASCDSTTVTIGCPGYIGQLYAGANMANINKGVTLNVLGGKYGSIFGGNNISGTVGGSVTLNIGNSSGANSCALEIDTVFGGGNLADLALPENKVTINVANDSTKVGNVYGGGKLAAVATTTVNISGGQISGNVFGGGMGSKTTTELAEKPMILSGGTNLNITGGTLTNVFGGNDAGGTIVGTLKTNINKAEKLSIRGEVYGGGNEADSESGQLYITCVDSIGSVFGGAKNSNLDGDISLNILAGKIGNVYGGNNLGGVISGKINVNVQHKGCSPIWIGRLYGAGNLADYTAPAGVDFCPVIKIDTCGLSTVDWKNESNHCLKIDTIFGAGKGATTGELAGKGKVIGNPQVNVYAGEIGTIFGGGNVAEVIGNTNVFILDQHPKGETGDDNQEIYVRNNVYGGGNNADVTGNTYVQIGPKK